MNKSKFLLWPWLIIAIPAIFLLFFFIIPISSLLSMSFLESDGTEIGEKLTFANYHFVFSHKLYISAIFRTFMIGISVGLIVILFSYPLAFFLVRTQSRFKGILIALSIAPLLASVVVRTYGWFIILNREGALNQTLIQIGAIQKSIDFLPSNFAIIIGLSHAMLPYGVLSIISSLNALNPNIERAASSLGANRFYTFLKVTLPLTLPGVAGGFLLAFSIAISAYATPTILGGPATETIATLVRNLMVVQLDWALGAAMGGILLFCGVGLILLSSVISKTRGQSS